MLLLGLIVSPRYAASQQNAKQEEVLRKTVARSATDLGIHYYQQRNYKKAAGCFEDALKYEPDNETYRVNLAMSELGLGRYDSVVTRLARIPLVQMEERGLTALALSYFAKGQYSQSLSAYEALAKQKPDDVVLLLTIAAVCMLDGQSDKAQQIMKQVPNNPAIRAHYHVILADAHRSRSNARAAIREYEEAISIDPTTPGVNYRLGGLYSDLNEIDKAVGLFRKELEVDPKNPDAHFSLGAYSLSFQNEPETARHHFQRSIELNPQHLEAYLGLMKVSLVQSKPAEVLPLAERIQSTGQENGELHYLKARALNLLGKKEQAEAELRLFEQWREETK